MGLKRDAETLSPLLSDEEILRRAALLQLTRAPTIEAAKAVINALLHWLEEKPEAAEDFVDALWQPPLGPLAEEPVLGLLKHPSEAVREQAAYILYKLKIRESSRAEVERALDEDRSPWVRAYAAKALAVLAGPRIAAKLAEAIDNEAALESISRMAEALVLARDPAQAEVLLDQADQLRERKAPADAFQAAAWEETARSLALYLEGLAAILAGSSPAGTLTAEGEGRWTFTGNSGDRVELVGGASDLGFAGRVHRSGHAALRLPQDSEQALARLPALRAET